MGASSHSLRNARLDWSRSACSHRLWRDRSLADSTQLRPIRRYWPGMGWHCFGHHVGNSRAHRNQVGGKLHRHRSTPVVDPDRRRSSPALCQRARRRGCSCKRLNNRDHALPPSDFGGPKRSRTHAGHHPLLPQLSACRKPLRSSAQRRRPAIRTSETRGKPRQHLLRGN